MKLSLLLAAPVLGGIVGNTFGGLEQTVQKAGLPLDSESFQSVVTAAELEYEANVLYNVSLHSIKEFGNPTRVIGSKGHFATLRHILNTLNKYSWYYDISVQPFKAVVSKIKEAELFFNGVKPELFEGMTLTPPTPNKDFIHGELVLVKNYGCDDSDYEELAAKTSANKNVAYIALVQRGSCAFITKSLLAGKHAAEGAIIFDNEYNKDLFHGTLGEPQGGEVPTMAITRKLAEDLVDNYLSLNKTVETKFRIDSYVKNVETYNVLAQTKLGDQDNVVMVGGHTDSVGSGPGINDDGSGTISLLVLAKHLTKFVPTNAVKFGFWAAEEEGLLGSTFYVKNLTETENLKHRLFLDYDMMASPNYAFQVYNGENKVNPVGSEEIRDLYIDWYLSQGLNYTLIPFDGRSDYAEFIINGIPGGGIAAGAEGVKTEEEVSMFGGEAGEWYDHCYHQLCDDLTNVDYFAWVVNTKLIAHSIGTYGKSLEGFPLRAGVKAESNNEQLFKYRGDSLVF